MGLAMLIFLSERFLERAIGVLIVLYLANMLFIAYHLKRKHEIVWRSIGSPSFLNWSIISSFKLGGYVLFSNRHKIVVDKILSYSIYAERALFILVLVLIAYWRLR
jgi:hypothetical protein